MQEKNQRNKSRVTVDILLNKYVKGRPYLCVASDLSSGGIRVRKIREPLLEEKEVGLQFQLPGDDRVISCAGRIIYQEGDDARDAGICFTSVSPEHQRLIDDFISHAQQSHAQQPVVAD